MKRENAVLYIVIPCYNEQEVLAETKKRLIEKINKMIQGKKISPESKIVFVNDGSRDNTWQMIKTMHETDPRVTGITLSRNCGHQNALLAGLMTVKDRCDICISMDADLQDDIEVLDEFVEKYYQGCEIVYGVRNSRKTDTWFKRNTAEAFYKMMKMFGVNIVSDHADYRLMSRRALEELSKYQEVNLFLRGIVPMLGFQTDTVEYERHERFAGESKYPLKKMISFAVDGITSFSTRPIQMITELGVLVFMISILFLLWVFVGALRGNTVSGWATVVISIWALGGLQLLAIGIIGNYIGKTYMETKARPRYIVEEFLEEERKEIEE